MKRLAWLIALAALAAPLSIALAGPPESGSGLAPGLTRVDKYTIKGQRSFLSGYPAKNADGTLNMIVEIPSGTTAKWEVMRPDGALVWEFKRGRPRVVRYLGYPGNYGMIPRTLYSLTKGGDRDPLDVLALGPAVPRGSLLKVRPVGVLLMLDDDERDDKIIALPEDSPFQGIDDLDQLKARFPGVLAIVRTWFANYKGGKAVEIEGFGDRARAGRIIDQGIAAFKGD